MLVETPPRTAAPQTIARLWQDAVARRREQPAYLVEEDGRWRSVSWPAAAEAVDELAHGLLDVGVRKGDVFAILASTCVQWALFDFALASIGAVGAGIYPNSSPRDVEHVLTHSKAVGILCEDDDQRRKLGAAAPAHVVTFTDLADLRARGREHARRHPHAVAAAAAAIVPDDLFTFIYTSGTTGPPKACMIRHRNYYAMVAKLDDLGDFIVAEDTMLLYLPLAHNFGRLMHLTAPYAGYTLAFCPDPYAVADALPKVRPTVLPSVPRMFEKMHTAVVAAFEAERGAKGRIITWALSVGRRASALRQQGRSLPPVLAVQHRIAARLVYAKVQARLGGRLRFAISGGAPLAREIAEFFHALDILILEGYGLTECTTAATVNRPRCFKFGTVGPALPGVELRLADDSELLIRSNTVFAGYYRDDDATREAFADDGWLRSGDIAAIDDRGFVTITDRKKDLLVTAGGKNVPPQNLENALKTSPFISHALVVGDRRPYIAALITLEDGVDRARAVRAVEAAVADVNSTLARFEQIKRFTILPRDFSPAEGEVTPTLKLRRRVCEDHFADEIAQLYA